LIIKPSLIMESDEEVFEDAVEELPVAPLKEKKVLKKFSKLKKIKVLKSSDGDDDIPLDDALEAAREAIDKFLNNNFDEARDIVQPLADKSIYHALGYGVILFLEAMMTFEQKHIEEASIVLSQACDTIDKFRKKSTLVHSLGKMLRKPDYDTYTDMEVHAELVFAEILLLKATLTFCEDETLVSFVKAGLKVRTCYQSFRECWSILQEKQWNNDQHRKDFESGVRMGVGAFNLLISLLPARVMKVLEFIGFGGNRDAGIRELQSVYEEKDGLRQFLACLVLLGYNLVVSFFLGNEQCNNELCKDILQEKLTKYPNGLFFLFFKGRYHFVQGEMKLAIHWYQKSCASQEDWPQLHHVCYWELIWAHQFSQDWWGAHRYATLLFNESKWSRCFYAYQMAVMLCMVQDDLTDEHREEQIELMEKVPKWKQRIAGKSLPMEKFAIRKSERFLKQGNFLVLPALELIYVWNGFRILGQSYNMIEPVYLLVEKAEAKANAEKNTRKFYLEDICLITLLKGMCLKFMNFPEQAEECFKFVINKQGQIIKDTYLIPYAQFELALKIKSDGQLSESLDLLEKTKNDYKDYMLQSRLHFRIHAVQTDIRAMIKKSKKENLEESSNNIDHLMPLQNAELHSMNGESFEIPNTESDAKKIIQAR